MTLKERQDKLVERFNEISPLIDQLTHERLELIAQIKIIAEQLSDDAEDAKVE